MNTKQRIEVIPRDPNPIFVGWLEEWLKEAERKNSMSRHKLKEALNSLKRFPLPLASGRDCAILRGFGPYLCNLLDKKVELYKKKNFNEYEKSIDFNSSVKKVIKEYQVREREHRATKKGSKLNLESVTVGNFESISASQQHQSYQVSTQDRNQNSQNAKIFGESDKVIIMKSGKFEIILLIDTQETSGKFKKTLDDTRKFLESRKIKYEVHRLGVGDFCWICRDADGNELILPYIIERKRMDDFASSIRDGRFHEQKFRLRDSGIQNLIYLIENHGNNTHVGLPMNTLMQAANNTQIHNGFQIKFTDNHRDSMYYICTLTKILIEKFKNKLLIETSKSTVKPVDLKADNVGLMNFKNFQNESSKIKQFRIKDIFIKQLLQLKTLSIDKALAITELYPTPFSLLTAYKCCKTKDEAEMLLANIPAGRLKRPIGSTISKVLYQFYNNDFEE